MSTHDDENVASPRSQNRGGGAASGAPTLPEDLLLMLFQPSSGSIAGETTLFYALAGAALADLAMSSRVLLSPDGSVLALGTQPPEDELLRSVWLAAAETPRGVQAVLAAIGPALRGPVLDRLVARGDLRRRERKLLGLIPTTVLELGPTGRRRHLVAAARSVLVDGAEPSARVASLIGLLAASGTLPQFHPEIPWTSGVIARAKDLESGDWGAAAAAEAVTRTLLMIILGFVLAAQGRA